MVQYLYSGYSLGGSQVPEARRTQVSAWRQIILGIAKEEMGHLVTVQNVLRFMGAPLALDREDYPWDCGLAPYPFTLERTTRSSLAKYVVVESPKTWPADVPPAERDEIERLASGYGGSQVNRVGALYDRIISIVSNRDLLPDSAFYPETFPMQASWDEWGRGYGKGARGSSLANTATTPDVLVMQMVSRDQAVAALRAVAEQGEAADEATAEQEASHFRRFLDVFRGFPADAAWDPAAALPENPIAPGPGGESGRTPITDPDAGLWANIFNIRYRMLLTYLAHTFNVPKIEEDERRRGVIINRMFGEMYNLRAIASLLARLPLSPGAAERAGPPFQMPYTLHLPDGEAAYWTLHRDLFAAAAALLKQAVDDPDANRRDYAQALLDLDAVSAREFALYAEAGDIRTAGRVASSRIV